MSELSGVLTDFPLRQVLRLVAAGSKSGILVVTGESVRGSVFFRDGRVIFATTRSGPSEARDLAEDRRRPAEADEARILTSVVMRLLRLHDGTFVFQSGVEPMHPTTGDLDVEEVLDHADSLMSVWEEIELAIGSIHQAYALRPSNDTENVTLTAGQWNVLATIGSGRSAAEIASRAVMPEFDVASHMAELVERKLIVPVERPEPSVEDEDEDEQTQAAPSPPSPPPPPAASAPSQPVDRPPAPAAVEHVEVDVAGQPTLAERYEYYVNSRGAELREPPPEQVSGIVLDLTGNTTDRVYTPTTVEEQPEPAPSSELARRWRDLQKGRPIDDE